MDQQRTYHGDINPDEMAAALVAAFNQGNMRTQQVGEGDKVMVQIATRQGGSGGKAALSITIQRVEDGVSAAMGQHEWLGVAASLGQTALTTLLNPWNLIGRLDDIAQDVTSLTLVDKAWEAVEKFAQAAQITKTISERLQTVACPFCGTANKVGAPDCVNCGAPLGE
ncbi:MAG TPA: zinc ribbon domain-containing protein, partial [Anaerolineales bacterium]|nr:zinc ribbon domain-containing protein [Anaerolineales bacterium]